MLLLVHKLLVNYALYCVKEKIKLLVNYALYCVKEKIFVFKLE